MPSDRLPECLRLLSGSLEQATNLLYLSRNVALGSPQRDSFLAQAEDTLRTMARHLQRLAEEINDPRAN